MAADTNDNAEKLTNWFDGRPSGEIQKDSVSLGSLTYWFDGAPYATAYPAAATARTSDMMPFFWGIG